LTGILITLEGVEGSGKSTQQALLADSFSRLGLPYLCSREPGGTRLGRDLRSLLLTPRPSGEKWRPEAELLLFYADRAQHLDVVVRPALAAGKIIVIDRFEDSTRAYQGARGVPEKTMDALRELVLKDLRPDLTLLLDADPAKTLERAHTRNGAVSFSETRFDDEGLDFHRSVREGFLKIASREPDRVRVINADENLEDVTSNIWSAVASKLASAGFL